MMDNKATLKQNQGKGALKIVYMHFWREVMISLGQIFERLTIQSHYIVKKLKMKQS